MSFNLQESFKKMNEGDVLLAYKGSITTDLITNVLEVIESKLDDINAASAVRKKIYNVLVESLQNLFHHIEEIPDEIKDEFDARFGVLVVAKENDYYRISTGNFVRTEKVKQLKEKIDKINSLSREELKDMYKFVLNHQKLSAKGGGGLGLIDIAKKTGNKIEYVFQSYNRDFDFFNLNVFISESKN
ncbi:MAG: SiaB family protein kinase [Bacteroidales bacterium]